MPLDPEAQALMDQANAAGLPPTEALPAAEARARSEALPRAPGPDVAHTADWRIPGPGAEIPVRIYTPSGMAPFPLTVWIHGGGWVIGSIETNDSTCRALANESGSIVVSVGYRLAPETKFPGGLNDCFAAAEWVFENAEYFGGDPSRIAIGGASAGGNLAAAVTLMARERGGPPFVHQLLVYPVTDVAMDTHSYAEHTTGYSLTASTMAWYVDHYLEEGANRADPLVSPLRAENLSGLPPAHVITAENDPLVDEGEAYAQRLADAGVQVASTRYDGMMHGFFNHSLGFDKSLKAIAEAGAALKAAFAAR
jgi:acetyl esterase